MVDGPVTNRRFSRRQVRQAMIAGAAVLLVLIIAIGGWSFYSGSSETAQIEEKQGLETVAKQQADKLAGFFSGISAQLKALAQDKSVLLLFEQQDDILLGDGGDQRVNQFDSALRLRMLMPGQYELDTESNPPLSYASLDLLRQAEQSTSASGMEVVLFGSPQQHIVIVQRVTNQAGELIGLLHLSLDVALFKQATDTLALSESYVELRQAARGRPLVLAKQGDAAYQGGEPVVVGVNGTRWTLAYWYESGTAEAEGTDSQSPMLLIAAVAIVLLLGAAAFVLKKRKSETSSEVPEEEAIVYAGAVQAIMDGAHPGMEKLVPNLPNLGQKGSIAPVSAGQVGDDVTMIMSKADVKAAAEQQVVDITGSEDTTEPPATPAATPAPAEQKAAPAETPVAEPAAAPASADTATEVSPVIFRSYDIRGIVGETLTAEIVTKIGQAIGSEAGARGQQRMVVGRDGRTSSPELGDALIAGIRASGRNVIDVGVVPTPVLYFATHFLEVGSGVMLTGSHNGPQYNGMKIVIDDETLSEEAIQGLYKRVTEGDMSEGEGGLSESEIIADYIRRISEEIPVALSGSLKLVVDCGNGVAGAVAPQLFRAMGHDVIELYCDVDGSFPNHHPDPSQPDNLQDLIAKVKEEEADMGLAFDGDGDRLGVVDSAGNIIWPDRQLMLLAKDVLSRNEGAPIIFDVKCSRHLKAMIEACGGKAMMSRTGHSLIKAKMKELDAPLAGEMSGHIFFKERWYGFDDAMYTASRLLEILVNAKMKPLDAFAELPDAISTPELKIELAEESHQGFMQELKGKMAFEGAEVIDIDGVRVEFSDGWGLIRPSNTTPCLVLRFEADNDAAMERIQGEFRSLLLSVNSELQLSF